MQVETYSIRQATPNRKQSDNPAKMGLTAPAAETRPSHGPGVFIIKLLLLSPYLDPVTPSPVA